MATENETDENNSSENNSSATRKKTDGNNSWVLILVAVIGFAGVIGAAFVNRGCNGNTNGNFDGNFNNGNSNGNFNRVPKKLNIAITKPSPDGKIDATRKPSDNAAYFPVGVNASGDAPSSDLGIYIIVFEDGDWYLQNHKEIKAGYQEIEAWSGGGNKNDAKIGSQVKVRAVAANINSTGEYMKTHKTVSEDAKELNPVALSNSVSATISSIK